MSVNVFMSLSCWCMYRQKLSGERLQSTDVIGDVTGAADSDVAGVYWSLTSAPSTLRLREVYSWTRLCLKLLIDII